MHLRPRFPLRRLLVSLALAGTAATTTASAAPFAYVPNEGSGNLSVIDTQTDQVVYEFPAGKKPRGTVISLDGTRAYVSDQPGNRLGVCLRRGGGESQSLRPP